MSFIIFFLIGSPLIIYYTMGYRYDFVNHQVSEVGLLLLETKPKQSHIYINNKLKFLKSPVSDRNLIPGEYDIKIIKEGYHTWEKTLPIQNKLTTFAQDIILFKKTDPVNIINGNFDDFIVSFKNSNLFTLWQDDASAEIWSYNLETLTNELLYRSFLNNSKIKIESLSASENNLLLNEQNGSENNFFVIKDSERLWQETETEIIYLNKIITEPIVNVKWDDSDDGTVFVQTANNLFDVNLNSKNTTKILDENISDFIVYDKILYHSIKLSCLVEVIKNQSPNNIASKNDCIYTFNSKETQSIIPSIRGLATVISTDSNSISVINLNNKKKIFQKNLQENIYPKNIIWNSPSNKMLYYNDFEINTFAPAHENPFREETISRYAKMIKKVLWYPSNSHLIAILNDSIKIIEVDARDKRNIVEYQNITNLKNSYIDPMGENIYFLGEKDGNSGIFQINIF